MIEKKFADRSSWGSGPWDSEPDKLQWETRSGLTGLLHRNSFGAWCGYVAIERNHPLFEVHYTQSTEVLRERMNERMEEEVGECPPFGVMIRAMFGGEMEPTPEIAFNVHGGITFASESHIRKDDGSGIYLEDDDREVWFFGFDCSHAGDLSPGMRKYHLIGDEVYRDMAYAAEQVESLAEQIKLIEYVQQLDAAIEEKS